MPTMRIWLTLVPIVCLLALLGNARARASRATRKAVRAALVVLALASFGLAYGDALLETTRAPRQARRVGSLPLLPRGEILHRAGLRELLRLRGRRRRRRPARLGRGDG